MAFATLRRLRQSRACQNASRQFVTFFPREPSHYNIPNSGNWRSIAAAHVIAAPLLATDVKTVPIELTTSKSPTRWDGPKFTLAIALIIGIVLFVAAMWYLPHPIVLPLLSVAAIAGAIVVALIAWLSTQRETADLSYWDVVGAMTMIGVCAALLSDPEQAIPLLEQRQNK